MSKPPERIKLLRALVTEGFGPAGAVLGFNLFSLDRLLRLKFFGGRHLRGEHDARAAQPRRIWLYWAQGLDAAPPVVRPCVESWRRENPDWEVVILDDEAASALVDLSDLPSGLSLATRADILRLRLLESHGGVWADATAYCARPLDHWIGLACQSGFFAFARPGPDRLLANWFLAATPGHPLVSEWNRWLTRYYVARGEPSPVYFATHYHFQLSLLASRRLRNLWRATPQLDADGPHLAQGVILGRVPETEAALLAIAATPISKLTYKGGFDVEALNPLLARAAEARARLRGGAA